MGSLQLDQSLALADRFPVGRKYLIAVSGGRDSVALLDLLVQSGFKKLVVCHLNHRLRGRESTADARFVGTLGRRHSLPVEQESADVKALASEQKLSIETAARLARHRFLFRVAARHRCRRVFLAHHADDQVETVLMNLFRGAGMRGLGGMEECSELHPPDGITARKPLQLIRPLLHTRRHEIELWLKERRLRWREDASNESEEFLRNRVRHQLLPNLDDCFGREVTPIVLRSAIVAREEERFIAKLVGEALKLARLDGGALSVRVLRSMDPLLQHRVVKCWLRESGITDVGREESVSVAALVSMQSPAKVNLPGACHARRRSGRIFLEKPSA